jgi:hypothetical protein
MTATMRAIVLDAAEPWAPEPGPLRRDLPPSTNDSRRWHTAARSTRDEGPGMRVSGVSQAAMPIARVSGRSTTHGMR